ncbi:MAG: hypothetical protein KAI40_12235 [Desulfobacterales bacterium]|nr:hypothetical protein [Desulfobacterales bacterium]
MKEETKIWLKYSEDNLDSAKILFKSKLFNPYYDPDDAICKKAIKIATDVGASVSAHLT